MSQEHLASTPEQPISPPKTPIISTPIHPIDPDRPKPNWDKLRLTNDHQRFIVSYFQGFEDEYPNKSGIQVTEILREDLSMNAFARKETIACYQLFSQIRIFLEQYDINIPKAAGGTHMLVARIIEAIWQEFTNDAILNLAIENYRKLCGMPTSPEPLRDRIRKLPGQNSSELPQVHSTHVPQESQKPAYHATELQTLNSLSQYHNQMQDMMNQQMTQMRAMEQQLRGMVKPSPAPLQTFAAPTPPQTQLHQPVFNRQVTQNNLTHHFDSPEMKPREAPRTITRQYNKPPRDHSTVQKLFQADASKPVEKTETVASAITKIQQFYKSDKQKFGGGITEDWNRALKKYEQYCSKLQLSKDIKASCIQVIFRDDAEAFYLSELTQYEDDYSKIISALNDRYNSGPRKRTMLDKVRQYKLAQFVDNETDEATALNKIARNIESIVPQLDAPYNDDHMKLECLRSAMMNTSWAQYAISSLTSNPTGKTYKKFFDELVAAEHQSRNFHNQKSSSPSTSPTITTTPQTVQNSSQNSTSFSKLAQSDAAIWYQTQARYGRDRKAPKRRSLSNGYSINCYNCGRQGHSASQCRQPRDEVKVSQARIEKILQGKTQEEKIRILKAFTIEQSEHINFISEIMLDCMPHQTEPEPYVEDPPTVEDILSAPQVSPPMLEYNASNVSNENPAFTIEEPTASTLLTQARSEQPPPDPFEPFALFLTANDQLTSSSSTPSTPSIPGPIPTPIPEHEPTDIPPITTIVQYHSQTSTDFLGACLDIGAQRSCIGLNQAKALLSRQQGTSLKLSKSFYSFRFGDTRYMSLGRMTIRIPTPDESFLEFTVDVVEPDVPLLIGIDVLDKHSLVADNVKNVLEDRTNGWTLPIIRKQGHMYITWNSRTIMFTRNELQRIHKHFWHPSASKLFNLLKRTHPEDTSSETLKILNEIQSACRTCAVYSKGPHRFRVSFPKEECVFNHELALDLMWLKKKPVLHVVDTSTHFSAAIFLPSKSTVDIWHAFLACWSTAYVGHPDVIRLDQESSFMSKEFEQLAHKNGIHLQVSGVQSHNAIGPGERYHAPLRRIFNRIYEDIPQIDRHLALQLAVKAMNDTVGPEGLVPTLLVFGTLPRFPPLSPTLPGHENRMKAMASARQEMADITAKLKIQLALRARVPPAAMYNITPGENVFIHDEKSKKWLGPYPVSKTFNKAVWVNRPDGERQYSLDHCLPVAEATGLNLIHHVHSSLAKFAPSGRNTDVSDFIIHITKVLEPGDPRQQEEAFQKAIEKEIAGLQENEVYEVVDRDTIPANSNILGGRFVLSIKNVDTADELFKARFVAQGHRDRDKNTLVHTATSLRHRSIRIIVALAVILGFKLWTQDVKQAFLQSKQPLAREVYIRPTPEFLLTREKLLKLLKPLYGLPDAGDYWDDTYTDFMKTDQQMVTTTLDLSFFYKLEDGKLQGMSGIVVDDGLHAGNAQFREANKRIEQTFKSTPPEEGTFRFAGVSISTVEDKVLIEQTKYAERSKILPLDATYSDFRSARQKLMWLTHSRPDILCGVNKCTQVTEKEFCKESILFINRIIRYILKETRRSLNYRKLDLKTLHLRSYSDSSFADNSDLTTQLGHIVFLCDNEDNCSILHYSSIKSRRVVRSCLGGEAYALADALDITIAVRTDLEAMLNCTIPIKIYTDNKSLFDVVTRNSVTTEKRLMLNIRSVREAYQDLDLNDMAWIRSEYNPADALTKVKENTVLNTAIDFGVIKHPVEQWIIRGNIS